MMKCYQQLSSPAEGSRTMKKLLKKVKVGFKNYKKELTLNDMEKDIANARKNKISYQYHINKENL